MPSSASHLDPQHVAQVLELVRNGESGQAPANATGTLETAIGELWSRIQADPDGFIMCKYEMQLFTFFQNRFVEDETAKKAVDRFWQNYRGDTSGLDGV